MAYELTGKVVEIFPTQRISEKFQKREFVIEKTENSNGYEFTDSIKFQLIQDKCGLVDSCQPGDMLKVSFNIKGKRWEKDGKVSYFTNLDAWKIEKISGENANLPDEENVPDFPKFSDDASSAPLIKDDQDDDLPF